MQDLFIGGAIGEAATLYLQEKQGFLRAAHQAWQTDLNKEDIKAAFFDADGDGDPDLVMGTGSALASFTTALFNSAVLGTQFTVNVTAQNDKPSVNWMPTEFEKYSLFSSFVLNCPFQGNPGRVLLSPLFIFEFLRWLTISANV